MKGYKMVEGRMVRVSPKAATEKRPKPTTKLKVKKSTKSVEEKPTKPKKTKTVSAKSATKPVSKKKGAASRVTADNPLVCPLTEHTRLIVYPDVQEDGTKTVRVSKQYSTKKAPDDWKFTKGGLTLNERDQVHVMIDALTQLKDAIG